MIILKLLDFKVSVSPKSYMDPQRFDSLVRAIRSAGGIYSRARGMNLVEIQNLPKLSAALIASGFTYTVSPELRAFVLSKSSEFKSLVDSAKQRFKPAANGERLFPFQEIGAAWLAGRDRALLGDDMGVGKTMQFLMAAPQGPVIIVTKAKAKGPWARHAANWRPDLKTRVLSGRSSFRAPSGDELVVTSYEILPPSLKEDSESASIYAKIAPGTTLVFDEVHKLGKASSLMTKRGRALAKAVWDKGGRVWGGTGTPLDNKPDKLMCILVTLGLFQTAFGGIHNFLRMFRGKKGFFGGFEYDTRLGAHPEAAECLRRVMLRRLYTAVFPEMPGKIYDPPIEVDIPPSVINAAREAELKIEMAGFKLEDVVLGNVSGDRELTDSIFRMRKLLAESKIPYMLDIVEDYEDQETPLIVFSAHRGPIEALRGRPGWAVITGSENSEDADQIQKAFQEGKLKGLGITIRAGGDALTLTAAHHALFVDLEWGHTVNLQAESRIYRYGQTRGVVIKIIVAKNTLDINVEMILRSKAKMIDSTINAAASMNANPLELAESLEKLMRSEDEKVTRTSGKA